MAASGGALVGSIGENHIERASMRENRQPPGVRRNSCR